MKKHELLIEAMKRYPFGTKFKGAEGDEFISSGIFTMVNGNILKDDYGLVYNNLTKKWSEIITEETRIPLLVSEDGVDLFEGNYYFNVQLVGGNNKKWKLISEIPSTGLNDKHFVFHTPNECKAFANKQAALDWIEQANKPKSKTLPLYFGQAAIINFDKSEVRIMDGDKEVSTLSFGDIKDLYVEIK